MQGGKLRKEMEKQGSVCERFSDNLEVFKVLLCDETIPAP